MSEALFSDERVCDSCGKKFDVQRPDLWRYVRVSGRGQLKMWFCSWGCMRKFDLRKDEDEMVKHDRKQIAEEMIRLAGEGQITSPAKYMMSIGYKQPYQAFDTLKADLESHNPELYTRLMDALGDKGKPRERKALIETPEAKKAEAAQTPEGPVKGPVTPGKLYEEFGKDGYKELPKITQPAVYDSMTVREVEGLFGRYRRTDVSGATYIDFEPADGADTMSLTVEHWRKFRAEHEKAVRILGVDL